MASRQPPKEEAEVSTTTPDSVVKQEPELSIEGPRNRRGFQPHLVTDLSARVPPYLPENDPEDMYRLITPSFFGALRRCFRKYDINHRNELVLINPEPDTTDDYNVVPNRVPTEPSTSQQAPISSTQDQDDDEDSIDDEEESMDDDSETADDDPVIIEDETVKIPQEPITIDDDTDDEPDKDDVAPGQPLPVRHGAGTSSEDVLKVKRQPLKNQQNLMKQKLDKIKQSPAIKQDLVSVKQESSTNSVASSTTLSKPTVPPAPYIGSSSAPLTFADFLYREACNVPEDRTSAVTKRYLPRDATWISAIASLSTRSYGTARRTGPGQDAPPVERHAYIRQVLNCFADEKTDGQ